jgi:hypothetical protein
MYPGQILKPGKYNLKIQNNEQKLSTMQKLAINQRPERNGRHPWTHPILRLSFIGLFTILAVTLSGISSSAQEVKDFGKMLAAMKASPDVKLSTQASRLESLVFNLQPSVSIQEGIISTYGDAPFVCVDIDVRSVSRIKEANPLFSQAELITITINNQNEMKMFLDLTSLTGFPRLKYIYFLCSFECTNEQINKLINTADSQITVFYSVSIPS